MLDFPSLQPYSRLYTHAASAKLSPATYQFPLAFVTFVLTSTEPVFPSTWENPQHSDSADAIGFSACEEVVSTLHF